MPPAKPRVNNGNEKNRPNLQKKTRVEDDDEEPNDHVQQMIDENEYYDNETVNAESFICSCCWVGQGAHSLKPKEYSEEQIKEFYDKWEEHLSRNDPNHTSKPKKKKKKNEAKKAEMDVESIFENKYKPQNQEKNNEDTKMQESVEAEEKMNEEEEEEEDDETTKLQKSLNLVGDHENVNMEVDEDDPSKKTFKPTDSFFIGVKNDDDPSAIIYQVKDTKKGDSFKFTALHEINLSAQPVCCEWVGHKFDQKGDGANFLAVGYAGFPIIELWDLDVMDLIPPIFGLGEKQITEQPQQQKQAKKAKKVTDLLSNDAHKSSVISLSWNKKFTHFLASGSQDHSIKIWDLNSRKCVQTLSNIFTEDVASVCWDHYGDQKMLFCGSGNILCYLDPRGTYKRGKNDDITAVGNDANTFSVGVAKINKQTHGFINSISANPHNPNEIAVSFDKGQVELFDKRRLSAGPIASIVAFKGKMVSGLDWSKKQTDVLFCCSCESNESLCLMRKEINGTVSLAEKYRCAPGTEENGKPSKSKIFCLSSNQLGYCGLGMGLPENIEVFDEEELMEEVVDEDEEMEKAPATH